eukprot:scaffold180831_cov13-Tisochrysis_lutea.AAC.1
MERPARLKPVLRPLFFAVYHLGLALWWRSTTAAVERRKRCRAPRLTSRYTQQGSQHIGS